MQYDVPPAIANFSYVHNINASNYDLVFEAANIPPLGMNLYYVERNDTNKKKSNSNSKKSQKYIGTSVSFQTLIIGNKNCLRVVWLLLLVEIMKYNVRILEK